jgi:hypothetical protein
MVESPASQTVTGSAAALPAEAVTGAARPAEAATGSAPVHCDAVPPAAAGAAPTPRTDRAIAAAAMTSVRKQSFIGRSFLAALLSVNQ